MFSRRATSASAAPPSGSDGRVAASGVLYVWATGRARSERALRSSSSSLSASLSSDSAALTPGIKAAVFGVSDSVWSRAISSAAAACRRSSSARARAAASRVCRSASCRMRLWSDLPIPSSTACASGRATRVSASWGPVIAHEEEESTDEHGDQHHARLRHDAARQRAFRGPDPLLPAAHRSPSLGREPPSGPLVADLQPPVSQYVAGDVQPVIRQIVSHERRLAVPELIERGRLLGAGAEVGELPVRATSLRPGTAGRPRPPSSRYSKARRSG